jgi:glycosyltransferase involved in cell wall biosynthesis
MKIYAIHNNSGSRYYRLIPQLKRMQELGHKVILEAHNDPHMKEHIDWADIVIFQMVFSPEWASYCKEQGKKVIFECDDLVHDVPKDHYSYKELKGFGRIKWLWRLLMVLRHADGFVSTTSNLNRVYGWMARKRLVFPNYLEVPHWLKEYKKNTTDRIRILWAGSTSHTPDLKFIQPVLDKILRKYPKVQFIYVGHGGIKSTDLQARFTYGDDLFEGLPDNREAMLSVPPKVWPYILSSLMADIAIAPLEENYFNKFKSQCKYLEYGINHIPGVFSRWHYTDIDDGVNGLVATSLEEWQEKLEFLIDNEQQRKSMGERAYNDVLKKHDIREHVDKWVDFVLSV